VTFGFKTKGGLNGWPRLRRPLPISACTSVAHQATTPTLHLVAVEIFFSIAAQAIEFAAAIAIQQSWPSKTAAIQSRRRLTTTAGDAAFLNVRAKVIQLHLLRAGRSTLAAEILLWLRTSSWIIQATPVIISMFGTRKRWLTPNGASKL
jgi:hypothetical protein